MWWDLTRRFGSLVAVLSLGCIGAGCSKGGSSSEAPSSGGGSVAGSTSFVFQPNFQVSDGRVNTNPAGQSTSRDARVAVKGSLLHVVWTDYRDGYPGIFYNRSENSGGTWLSSDTKLNLFTPNTPNSYSPKISLSGESVFVTWVKDTLGGAKIYFNRSLDKGATWLPNDVTLCNLTNFGGLDPQIASDGTNVYVVWKGYTYGGASGILFNSSSDSGSTWQGTEVRIDTGTLAASEPMIAAIGDTVHVVWSDARSGESDIYYSRSSDGGLNWLGTDVRLDHDVPGAARSRTPQIAQSEDKLYVVWSDSRTGMEDIYFNKSMDGGATWLGADRRLDTDAIGTSRSINPRIVAQGDTIHTVWNDNRDGKFDVYANSSLDGGTTWLGQDALISQWAAGAFSSAFPEIGMSGQNVYVVWQENRSSPLGTDIYFNYSADDGQTWPNLEIRLDTDAAGAAKSSFPRMALSEESVFVVWEDYRNGSPSDIYISASTP